MHDEDTGRPDDDVVDPRAWPARRVNVVQDLEAIGTQQLKRRTDEVLVALTLFQVPRGSFGLHHASPC
jgi:hypothetical protein